MYYQNIPLTKHQQGKDKDTFSKESTTLNFQWKRRFPLKIIEETKQKQIPTQRKEDFLRS